MVCFLKNVIHIKLTSIYLIPYIPVYKYLISLGVLWGNVKTLGPLYLNTYQRSWSIFSEMWLCVECMDENAMLETPVNLAYIWYTPQKVVLSSHKCFIICVSHTLPPLAAPCHSWPLLAPLGYPWPPLVVPCQPWPPLVASGCHFSKTSPHLDW